jgi:hypothetical protein
VTADHDTQWQSLAARDRGLIDVAQVARCHKVDAGRGAAVQHEAPQADIILAGGRIAREVHAGGDVEAAILAVLQMNRKLGEVDVGAGLHHRLHRRFLARDLHDLGLAAQPAQDFGQELRWCHPEGSREP